MAPRVSPMGPEREPFQYTPGMPSIALQARLGHVRVDDPRVPAPTLPGGTPALSLPRDGETLPVPSAQSLPMLATYYVERVMTGAGPTLDVWVTIVSLDATRRGARYELYMRADVAIGHAGAAPTLTTRVGSRLSLPAPAIDDEELIRVHDAIGVHALEQLFADDDSIRRINAALATPAPGEASVPPKPI